VVWWVVLFAVLPFGLRSQHDAGEVVPGTPSSAPVRPKFLQIILATTVIAAAILVSVYAAFTYGLIDLRPALPQPGQT
jgi:predicted secreted protein